MNSVNTDKTKYMLNFSLYRPINPDDQGTNSAPKLGVRTKNVCDI